MTVLCILVILALCKLLAYLQYNAEFSSTCGGIRYTRHSPLTRRVLSTTSSASLSPDLAAREGIAGGPPPPPPSVLANGLDMAMMYRGEVYVVTESAVRTNRYHVSRGCCGCWSPPARKDSLNPRKVTKQYNEYNTVFIHLFSYNYM